MRIFRAPFLFFDKKEFERDYSYGDPLDDWNLPFWAETMRGYRKITRRPTSKKGRFFAPEEFPERKNYFLEVDNYLLEKFELWVRDVDGGEWEEVTKENLSSLNFQKKDDEFDEYGFPITVWYPYQPEFFLARK